MNVTVLTRGGSTMSKKGAAAPLKFTKKLICVEEMNDSTAQMVT